ncbi:BTAD domain-containing putative transcriptional regulator [Actinomadura sp. DC4]|uniref:AfsR/SARP family transcriptional regulator n=1 Tax=Actinomadura sp. DC4 TaxID=3055069 RepID=UPI0025B0E1E3|nr:BTAD domain-containing putative transcriptional regulator [Actinomadura sp. DC4]MDN3353575.1 BTAD domain-containing putative transcriptional regulator [Actinomadura sp. DC4]
MATEEVGFRVLGRLTVDVGGSCVLLPRSPILQGLLGVLVLARGEALPISRLAELVWTDRASETSREAVHVGVSRLRKWLAGLDGGRAGQVTIRHEDGYLLECPAARSDLGRFLVLAGEARTLAVSDERYRALLSAFAERKGPLLAGLPRIDRTDPLVRGIEDEVRQAALDLSDAALEAGVPEGAVTTVGALAEEFNFDELLHATLIDLLAASGRPAEALQTYRRLSDRLEAELGIEPSEEVRLAHMRVLSFGRQRPNTGSKEPAVPVPAQLPPDIPDFTGRAAEAAELARVLVRGAGTSRQRTVAIATVAGMAGLGKTTLAVHVAHKIAGSFPAGQLYADLHGDSATPAEPGDVLGGFLRTLPAGVGNIPASLDERMALFRSRLAGRRTLIVLDNVAREDQVRPLLPGTPDAAVLITGRNRLIGLEGARLLNLDVLPSAQAVDLIANIVGERRVAEEPDVAVEIARLCGHVPLALRIAAARLLGRRHWTLAHLAGVLSEERRRLDELVAGDLEVRAGFALSYRLLPAETQRAFRLFGLVNAPDIAAWTVAALLDRSVTEAQHHLELLIDAQLVGVAGTDRTGQLRYKVHDLLRLYARERAEREDTAAQRAAALHRALGAWLALAEKAADRVAGPCYAAIHGPAPRWPLPVAVTERLLADPMRWFTAERAALVAEVAQACDLLLTDFAWDIAASMEKYCDVRGMYEDWRQMHERAMTLCRETGDRLGEAVLLRGLLEVTTWTSPAGTGPVMTRLHRLAEELLDLFTDLGDPVGMADAMVGIVWGRIADGRTAEALALAEHALHVARAADYLGGQARAYHVMAAAHGEDDAHGALECLEHALVIAKELGNPRFLATIVQFLGAAHALCGDLTGGMKLLDESIVMARDQEDRFLESFSLLYLAKLFVATGDDRARPTLELTLAYGQVGEFGHHLADALGVLGELNLAEGDLPAAVDCLERSVRGWRDRGWIPYLARALRSLGDAYSADADHAAARTAWTEARELFARTTDDAGKSSVESRLASLDPAGQTDAVSPDVIRHIQIGPF